MPDRLAAVLTSTTTNGIDFVEIASPAQTCLVVHFLNAVSVAGTLIGTAPVTITGGESVPAVPVQPIGATDWAVDDLGRQTLTLNTPFCGDFSFYDLAIASSALDPFFAHTAFTFKAGCPSLLDCAPPPAACPVDRGAPAIDYQAKDFASFRQALLDYSALAYPAWVERDEPDLGMLLVELLAAVGDDLSYVQDRVATEATLATATQRRSVIRHARLVDYEPRPLTSARTVLQVDVTTGSLVPGTAVLAPQPDGTTLTFEIGPGLLDPATGLPVTDPVVVDPRWNRTDHTVSPPVPRIVPYLWDDSERCLASGATETWVLGHGFAFTTGDPQLGTVGTALLIDTAAASPIDPPVREVVHLTGALEEVDELFGHEITQVSWDAQEALAADHDLVRTVFAGNLVPASEGARHIASFVVDPAQPTGLAAVVRGGPDAGCEDAAPSYAYTLPSGRLAWLPDADADARPVPELVVQSTAADSAGTPTTWRWRRSLLDADPFETAFTLDPVRYSDLRPDPLVGFPWWDYDGDDADSLRFGDGTFGDRPASGAAFQMIYRVGSGAAGNVAADTVTGVSGPMAGVLLSVTNPFAATGGADEESLDDVRRNAPHAFRAQQFRAVRAEDYDAAAEQLSWVLDAGTEFRWTGSWRTVFTTAQPRGREDIPLLDHLQLVDLLDRRRLVGYEVYAPDPRYVSLDLVVTVCALSTALRGEVLAAIAAELGTGRRADGAPAFFAPDQFRFGTPLERSELDSAVQRATGVDGVVDIAYRRRGYLSTFAPLPQTVVVGADQILRVDNDPSRPERGSLRIVVEGGK